MPSSMMIVPAILGALIVMQAGINRKIATSWGLPAAVLLNALILSGCAILFLVWSLHREPSLESEFRSHVNWRAFSIWFLLPGIIGFCLVLGGPWSIARWGAAQTFVLLVSSQLLMSVIWDLTIEGLAVSKTRWLGVALAWLGVVLSTRGS